MSRHLKNGKKSTNRRAKVLPSSPGRKSRALTPRQREEKIKCLDAIGLVRSGKAKTASAAARQAGTTTRNIRKLVPAALIQNRPGARIRVKAADPYSARVEILTDSGAVVVIARGSRQRELAGRHRATYIRVLAGKEPISALEQYRGRQIGGQELISDSERLFTLAQAGVLGQLDSLYVSPDGGR